jgi:hypothetical protein
MVPLSLRPDPPLLAAPFILSAYHHAVHSIAFDAAAAAHEVQAAHIRAHPGVGNEEALVAARAARDAWKKLVNWVMDERRLEKLCALNAEREQHIHQLVSNDNIPQDSKTKRPRHTEVHTDDRGGIFKVPWQNAIRPALAIPSRPISPRRMQRRTQGGTYTPPRILPSGDETAPAPSLKSFAFVSPLRSHLEPVTEERTEIDPAM